jgi:8-oxo-dGTP pyrophosphatase MutT (NUDIX family)
MSLHARIIEEGREPTKSELAKGKKPSDISWKDWLQAGGAYKGKTKAPKKSKKPKKYKDSFHDPYKTSKKTHAKSKSKGNWWDEMTKGMDEFEIEDDPKSNMGWYGVGGGKHSSKKTPPRPKRTPEEEKIHQLVKSLGTIPRTAAGGIVFKTFEGPDFWELPVLVSQVHPKYGSYWVFPKGGLDLGESMYKGAAREVREEAGVKAKVVSPLAYKKMSRFGESGKYDLPLVIDLLKKKNPKEAKFIEANKEKFRYKHFSFANHSHYFIMKHTGGTPRKKPGKDEEMARSEWIPLRDAVKRASRMKDVIKFLTPVLYKMWKPTKGVEKKGRAPKPFGKKPKQLRHHKPWKDHKFKSSKPSGPKPKYSTGSSQSFLW